MNSIKTEIKFQFNSSLNRYILIIKNSDTLLYPITISLTTENYLKLISDAVEQYEVHSSQPFQYNSIYELRDSQ